MSHMVIYRGTDGKPGYHQTDDIHDAVTFVEQLRNDNGVEHARIFRLEEVNFEYRPYFRVELKAGDPSLAAAPAVPAVEAPAPSTPPTPAVAAAASVADGVSDTASGVSDTASGVGDTATSAGDTAGSVTESASAAASSAASEAAAAVDPAATVDAGTLTDAKLVDTKAPDAATSGDKTDSDNGVGARRGLFGR